MPCIQHSSMQVPKENATGFERGWFSMTHQNIMIHQVIFFLLRFFNINLVNGESQNQHCKLQHNAGGFIAFKPSIPKSLLLDGKHTIESHFILVNHQVTTTNLT